MISYKKRARKTTSQMMKDMKKSSGLTYPFIAEKMGMSHNHLRYIVINGTLHLNVVTSFAEACGYKLQLVARKEF